MKKRTSVARPVVAQEGSIGSQNVVVCQQVRLAKTLGHRNGVQLAFIEPGKPSQNAFVEAFNGCFRDECLNEHWFLDLDDARRIIEAWRLDYNAKRPHSALGYQTPEEFASSHQGHAPGGMTTSAKGAQYHHPELSS